jgi:2'-5' RNA ligase
MGEPSRFAFYLVPPYPIARDLAEIHGMLEKQFGFKAAGRFQAHCTIKGFFKKNAMLAETLVSELDGFLAQQKPFEVEFNQLRKKPTSVVLRIDQIDGKPNQELLRFREQIVEITRPYIAPDCDFVDSDLGPPFEGHFTLAFRDIFPKQHSQVVSWLADAPIPTGKFTAQDFHFLEFFSQDWEGAWWESLTWKLLKSWRLA